MFLVTYFIDLLLTFFIGWLICLVLKLGLCFGRKRLEREGDFRYVLWLILQEYPVEIYCFGGVFYMNILIVFSHEW